MCFFSMAAFIHLRQTCTHNHMHLYKCMHNMWIVNTGMQTCRAGLLSESHAGTRAPILPASVWLNGNALFAFLLGSLQGSNNRALSITLQLLWTSLCKTSAHLQPLCFVQCPWFSAHPVAHKSSIWMTTTREQEELAPALHSDSTMRLP